MIYFLFSFFSNPIINFIQNDRVVYRCPSGVETHDDSGYRYGIVNNSKRFKGRRDFYERQF